MRGLVRQGLEEMDVHWVQSELLVTSVQPTHHLQGSIVQLHRDDEGEPLDEGGGGLCDAVQLQYKAFLRPAGLVAGYLHGGAPEVRVCDLCTLLDGEAVGAEGFRR